MNVARCRHDYSNVLFTQFNTVDESERRGRGKENFNEHHQGVFLLFRATDQEKKVDPFSPLCLSQQLLTARLLECDKVVSFVELKQFQLEVFSLPASFFALLGTMKSRVSVCADDDEDKRERVNERKRERMDFIF